MLKLTRASQSQSVKQAEVTGRKGIGLAERSHGHVLCCPFANTGNFTQPIQESVGLHDSLKPNLPVANGTSESSNGVGSRAGQADAGKLGIGEDLGRRKKMGKATCCGERLPETAYHPASKGCRALYGDLLAQNRPRREFETIPAARYTDPRIDLNLPS
jgi:hypothetical protein